LNQSLIYVPLFPPLSPQFFYLPPLKLVSQTAVLYLFLLNQQSEYEVFYKLMSWLVINGMQEIHPVIYLLIYMFSHN
jgi:hypothetical protein